MVDNLPALEAEAVIVSTLRFIDEMRPIYQSMN
jgi:hypothetical protein